MPVPGDSELFIKMFLQIICRFLSFYPVLVYKLFEPQQFFNVFSMIFKLALQSEELFECFLVIVETFLFLSVFSLFKELVSFKDLLEAS